MIALKKSFFILPVLILSSLFLKAQHYYFKHYNVENGLSNNSVICSLQDKNGFMWFGTKDGLNRYDGYTFKVYRNDRADSESIGSNFILSLYETREGTLWAGTNKGLYQYDDTTESFHLLKGSGNNEIRDIEMDDKKNLWFIAGTTLHKYNMVSKSTMIYNPNIYFNATSICLEKDGALWTSTDDGSLKKYNAVNNSFSTYNVFLHSKHAVSRWIEEIYAPNDSSLLVGTSSQGIKLFNTRTGTYKDILTYNRDKTEIFARDFIKNNEDEYWIATESGIFIYHIKTEKITNLRKKYGDPYSVSDNALYTLCKDKEGGIWAGTYFGGVNYYPKQYNSFDKFYPDSNPNSLNGNAIREICQDRFGAIWIGTEDAGLNKLNLQTGDFAHFKPVGTKSSICYSNIHGLLATDNELWIGTFEHGLDIMDIPSGKVTRHYSASDQPNSLRNNFIHDIYKTRSGDIIIATARGLYQYNRAQDNFHLFTEVPSNLFYTVILEDRKGILWIGTYRDGIYFFDPKTGKGGNYKYDAGNENSLNGNRINGIFEDSNSMLWLTTDDGFCRLVPGENSFTRYTTKNGLPGNVAYSILEDEKQHLWISTSKGLVNFNTTNGKMTVYTKAYGLLSDQFNYSSAFQSATGRMYFGSLRGLISFQPSQFIKNNFIPPVYITGFQVNNLEMVAGKNGSPVKKSIPYLDKVVLKYNQSTFSIDFAALSYSAPEMTEYKYLMEGLDKNWTYLKTNRKAYFTGLSPGRYTFKVKAATMSGTWNSEETKLVVEVHPPFWASVWAYLLYTVLFAALVYYVTRFYYLKSKEKNERKIELLEHGKEKEIYQAKIEFFTNVAHEIRTPLTLIKLPLENTMLQAGHLPEIRNNLILMEKNTNRLIDLTNQLLDFRKTETNGFSLNFVKTNISDLLEEMYTRFKPVAEQKNIDFSIKIPGIPLFAFVDPEAFNKILSNRFTNAVKYAKKHITVHLLPFSSEDKVFTIKVKNDGYLIPNEMKEKVFEPFFRMKETDKEAGTGIGLSLSRSLAELHKGSLDAKSGESKLNVFTLELPIHQEKEFHLYNEKPEKSEASAFNSESLHSDKPLILLVEDNHEIATFIANDLIKKYTVIIAYDGKEALKLLSQSAVQLIISDVMMPVMDGFELCKKVKTTFELSHIPIILLTAKTTLQSKIEGLELGADAYIEKPFSQLHLQAQVANLLTNRVAIREYFANSPLVHIKTMAYSKTDENFLEALHDAIQDNIADASLDIDKLAHILNMSRPTLYRKIKAISNLTPNELINLSRLKKAAELLILKRYKIYEVADMVGYNHQSNFTRDFLKQFGMTPTDYLQANQHA